jgi:uncharacterized peroxidase-related enzyme
MPRIAPVDPHEAPQEIAAIYEELKKTKWRIPMMYQILAHHPAILKSHENYFDAVMNRGLLDRKLKELIAYKVASLNGCAYSTASHRRYALKCGATEAELQAVESMAVRSMGEREAAALQLAEAMNESGLKVTEAVFKNAQSHFSPAEIIELLATVGLMVFASRLADTLGLQADS